MEKDWPSPLPVYRTQASCPTFPQGLPNPTPQDAVGGDSKPCQHHTGASRDKGSDRSRGDGWGRLPAHPVTLERGLPKAPLPRKKQSELCVYLHNICIPFTSDLHKSPSLGLSSWAVLQVNSPSCHLQSGSLVSLCLRGSSCDPATSPGGCISKSGTCPAGQCSACQSTTLRAQEGGRDGEVPISLSMPPVMSRTAD